MCNIDLSIFYDKLDVNNMSDDVKRKIEVPVTHCMSVRGQDECDTVFQMFKCFSEIKFD